MGNRHTRQGRKTGDEGWVTVYVTPEDDLAYDPATSFALCVGVDKQISTKFNLKPLGEPAANDAIVIKELLTKKYHLPEENTCLYTGESASTENIKTTLVTFAKHVGKNGMLLFQFSGHGHKTNKGKGIVIPADFDGGRKTTITTTDIADCVRGCNARYLVLMVDCCHAGHFAQEVAFCEDTTIPTYVLASCTSLQKSVSLKALRNGFFTYFLARFLRQTPQTETFPTTKAVAYCKPLVGAMTTLIRPSCGEAARMDPQIFISNIRLQDDDVDGSSRSRTLPVQYKFAQKYLKYFHQDGPIRLLPLPALASHWLRNPARGALISLQQRGILCDVEVRCTILALMAQSVVVLVHDEKDKKDVFDLFKIDGFVSIFIHLSELLNSITEDGRYSDSTDMAHCLECYATKVKQAHNIDFKDKTLEPLVMLLSLIMMDLHKQAQKMQQEAGREHPEGDREISDEVDGFFTQQALDRLDEVDRDAAQIPPLPDITDSETGEL